jgi:hypothetical protein
VGHREDRDREIEIKIYRKTGLLAPGQTRHTDACACIRFPRHFVRPRGAGAVSNVTSIEKRGKGQRMPIRRWGRGRRRRHRGKTQKARREMQHPIYF